MKRILFLVVFVSFGTVMLSCMNALFTEVNTTPPSDLWFTAEPTIHYTGMIRDDHNGGKNPLPATAIVVIGWELPGYGTRAMYIYGTGSVTPIGNNRYKFDVTLLDTLPKFVLKNMDTIDAISAGHIFLLADATMKTGDTIKCDLNWDNSYKILGSLNDIGIIFVKGNPTLAGQPPKGAMPGFNLLEARRLDPSGQSVTDFGVVPPFGLEITVDDDGQSCKDQTPFWIHP